MKTVIQIIFLLFCCSIQAQELGKTEQKLKHSSNKEEQAKLYLEHAQNLKFKNPDEVIAYAQKAIRFSEKNSQTQADAYQLIGNCHIIIGDYKKAVQSFEKTRTMYQNNLPENHMGMIKVLGSLGVVASEQNNYPQALQYYFEALQIADTIHNNKMKIILYNNIGVIYKSTKQFEKAKDSFQKSLKLQIETKDNQAGITLTNLATIALERQEMKKSYDLLQEAKSYLKLLNDSRAWGEWNNNLGKFYLGSRNFIRAEVSLNQALRYFNAIDDQFGSADTHLLLATLYYHQNQNPKAILHAQKALEQGENLHVLEHKLKANQLLSEIYEDKGNTDLAMQYYKTFAQQKDSLLSEENTRKLTEADLNYSFQKKQLESQLMIRKANAQKWVAFLTAALAVISLLALYLWKSKKQVKQKLLLEKELLEYEQKALHLQMNPHFVFNCLAAISSYIVQNKTEDAAKYLAMFSKLMRFTLESSKESLITIDKEIESISQYLNLENLRLNKLFTFSIEKSKGIEDDMALPPMLLQPIVENAIIHGILPLKQKGNIEIKFHTNENQLFIDVTDNGIGIENSLQNKNKIPLHRSMATDIVKKRLSMITKTQEASASVLFKQQSQGTTVKIMLPVQYKS